MSHTVLKQLQSRRRSIVSSLSTAKNVAADKQRECDKICRQLTEVDRSIDELTTKEIIVSEHAILRFIERIENMDINSISEYILSQVGKKSTLSNFKIKHDGVTYVVRNRVVVTVEV